MALQQGAVGVAPSSTANVVDIAWVANGEDEGCGLDIVELLDVAGKDVDHGVSDACEDNTFDVALFETTSKLLLEPDGELIVRKIANSHEGAVC